MHATAGGEVIDFTSIKQAVSMEQVLEHYGLTPGLRRTRDGFRGVCPVHSGHNPTQFSVSTSRNCWVCFGDCGRGGSAIDFVSCMERVSLREAAQLVRQWFGVQPTVSTSQRARSVHSTKPAREGLKDSVNEPLPFMLGDLDSTHPYLMSRALLPATIATFGVGYCTKGLMAGRITIPIHNAAGKIVAYAGRTLQSARDGQSKYLFPRGFRKSLELFNYHRAIAAAPQESLVVVEGFFDCMKVWQAGFERVVAIMGSSLSDAQENLIVEAIAPHGNVLLMFDEDGAGRTGREKAAARLARNVRVKVVELDAEGIQPDHLPACEIMALLTD